MAKRSKKNKARGGKIPAKVATTGAVAQGPLSFLGRDWFWGFILVSAVILAYLPLWHAGYIWDDDLVVTENPVIVGPLGLKEIWTTPAADICPLTLTTFWIEHALWGLAALPYHLVNVLMHGFCAVLLWQVLRSLRIPGAWLGAALWALHPVEMESVAWVTEMKNTESCLFFLLSILFFVRWLSAKGSGKPIGADWSYIYILLFAALAMASKSSTVILPVVFCLCAWWMEGRWRWRNLVIVSPVILMSIAATLASMWTQGLHLAQEAVPQPARSWPERMATAGDAVWFYMGKLLWPHPLIMIYPRWVIDAGQWISYLPLVAVVVILIILWIKRDSWSRPWFFAFAYFVAALLPVVGLADLYFQRYSFVADHFQYLASIGPLALAGAGMARLAAFIIPEKSILQSILGAGVLLILGLSSWHRTWVYEGKETLWADTIASNPGCWLAHNNLGQVLLDKGKADEAMAQFQEARELNPKFDMAYYNIGFVFFKNGRMDEAMTEFQKCLEINRNNVDAHNNLGSALMQKGRVDESIVQFQKALQINSNMAGIHYNFANALTQKGEFNEAIEEYKKALNINPDYTEAYNNLGIALAQNGRVEEAISQFQEALRRKPSDSDTKKNLTKAQAMLRQTPDAK